MLNLFRTYCTGVVYPNEVVAQGGELNVVEEAGLNVGEDQAAVLGQGRGRGQGGLNVVEDQAAVLGQGRGRGQGGLNVVEDQAAVLGQGRGRGQGGLNVVEDQAVVLGRGQGGGQGRGQGGLNIGEQQAVVIGRGRGRGRGIGGRHGAGNVDAGDVVGGNVVEYAGAGNARFVLTQSNAVHPLFVLQIDARTEHGLDIGSEFVFEKKTSYGVAFKAGDLWKQPSYITNDKTYRFNGAEVLTFGVSYLESGGIEDLKSVGIGPLRRALFGLAQGGRNDWKKNFHVICAHIAESARFYSIANHISATFTGFDVERSVVFDGHRMELVKNWSCLSGMIVKGAWHKDLMRKLGIDEARELPNVIAMLKLS